mmetsp:Transcript_1797/g.2991  ORF Transcript_1797/g.2991 Transcript_1797/m.2991 type:complete len:243 (-) Transcript_1797:1318-2046(-)
MRRCSRLMASASWGMSSVSPFSVATLIAFDKGLTSPREIPFWDLETVLRVLTEASSSSIKSFMSSTPFACLISESTSSPVIPSSRIRSLASARRSRSSSLAASMSSCFAFFVLASRSFFFCSSSSRTRSCVSSSAEAMSLSMHACPSLMIWLSTPKSVAPARAFSRFSRDISSVAACTSSVTRSSSCRRSFNTIACLASRASWRPILLAFSSAITILSNSRASIALLISSRHCFSSSKTCII